MQNNNVDLLGDIRRIRRLDGCNGYMADWERGPPIDTTLDPAMDLFNPMFIAIIIELLLGGQSSTSTRWTSLRLLLYGPQPLLSDCGTLVALPCGLTQLELQGRNHGGPWQRARRDRHSLPYKIQQRATGETVLVMGAP